MKEILLEMWDKIKPALIEAVTLGIHKLIQVIKEKLAEKEFMKIKKQNEKKGN